MIVKKNSKQVISEVKSSRQNSGMISANYAHVDHNTGIINITSIWRPIKCNKYSFLLRLIVNPEDLSPKKMFIHFLLLKKCIMLLPVSLRQKTLN